MKNHQLNNQNPKDNTDITTTFGNFWILKLQKKIIQSIHPPKCVEGKFQVPPKKWRNFWLLSKHIVAARFQQKTGAGSKASTVQMLGFQTFWGFSSFSVRGTVDGQNAIFLVNI